MKLISKLNPFRSKKSSRSLSRSDPSSFSSTSTDSAGTPTSILQNNSSYLTEAFKMMDKKGDGKIDSTHIENILTKIGQNPRQEVKEMVSEIDTNGDGYISLEEFGAVGSGSAFDPTDEELREAFGFFDADCDGKITSDELRGVFVALGDDGCTLEDCGRMIAEVGMSGDGFVCFEDFVRMMELQR